MVKSIACFAAALIVVAALVKFFLTFSLSAAFALGVGTFALICLASSERAPTQPPSHPADENKKSGVFAGLMRIIRFEDHDDM